MNFDIESSWKKEFHTFFKSNTWIKLSSFLSEKYKSETIYPSQKNIFSAFNLCPFGKVKVVIVGQDPYHGFEQAHGLSFSVKEGIKTPPSLKNIFKELESDTGTARTKTDLSDWAKQGVLLLNSVLTVEDGSPTSHTNQGWEEFTDHIIKQLSDDKSDLVFVLWGSYAQKKGQVIDRSKHLVLEAPHPSPLSSYRGFFGSKPFSKINSYLSNNLVKPINW